MANAKKEQRDVSVGSTFLISTGADSYPAQIKVLSRDGGKVEIQVSSPARPKTCPDCGHEHGLSLNAGTGIVVCMTTGCGRDFGYEVMGTRTVNVSDIPGT